MKILINVKEIYVISFLEKNKLMASLTPTPTSMILIRTTSMIDRIEKYLLSSRGKLRKDSDLLKKAFYIYWKLPKTNIQNYIAIFSEEDPLYRTHNSEIGNIVIT